MVLERFGKVSEIVKKDGFKVDSELYFEVEGSIPATMAKSIGIGVLQFSDEFQRINPDLVLIIGDRYEAFIFTIACFFLEKKIVHIHGGELTHGAFDDCLRHSISKLSNFHFVSHIKYMKRLIQLGEDKKNIFVTGALGAENFYKFPSDLHIKG